MKETDRIADQLKRAFHGDAWSGPCVKEVLEGVNSEIACQRPLPGVHSIWELVHHITAWLDIVRQRVEGTEVKVTEDVNFPPVQDGSEDSWRASLTRMERAESALRETIVGIAESRLDEPATPGGDPVYILLHGAVQHSLYHAGQIILLKRCTLLKPPGA